MKRGLLIMNDAISVWRVVVTNMTSLIGWLLVFDDEEWSASYAYLIKHRKNVNLITVCNNGSAFPAVGEHTGVENTYYFLLVSRLAFVVYFMSSKFIDVYSFRQ